VETGIAEKLFGYRYYAVLRKMTQWYVRSVLVFLGLSLAVWLVGTVVSLFRMEKSARQLAYRRSAETVLWSILLGVCMTAGSALILGLLSAMNYKSAVAFVNAFCVKNAYHIKAAMVSIIAAPLVEEIAFRGLICNWLRKKSSHTWIAILISAVFFGLWHRNLGQFAYTLVFGVLTGYVYLCSGTVIWPMLMHFIINLLAILAHSNNTTNVFGAWPALYGLRQWLQNQSAAVSVLGLVALIAAMVLICLRIKKIQK